MPNPLAELVQTAAALAKGMSVTFGEMMSPTVTENYPDEPPKFEQRFRGQQHTDTGRHPAELAGRRRLVAQLGERVVHERMVDYVQWHGGTFS